MRRETPTVGLKAWFLRTQTGRSRVLAAAALGALAGLVAAWFAPWQLTVLIAWDLTALFVIIPVWMIFRDFDAEQTSEFARREDNTRRRPIFSCSVRRS